MADLEHNVPITPRTPFYMASVSKQLAAAAVSLLVLDGKLSLNDDVRTHVPELPTFGSPITIRHLLTHERPARLSHAILDARHARLSDHERRLLETLSAQRELNFPSGTEYSYSNTGYVLLSIVVERVSGKSLRAFTQERIFAPLGMTSHGFAMITTYSSGTALRLHAVLAADICSNVPHFGVVATEVYSQPWRTWRAGRATSGTRAWAAQSG